MIAFKITVNLHFPEKCIRDRRIGKARELPFTWGEDIYFKQNKLTREKDFNWWDLKWSLHLWLGKQFMGDNRAPQCPAKIPCVHIVSLSSPARLRVKAFSYALGGMGCSCLNLFKKYPENVIINHPPKFLPSKQNEAGSIRPLSCFWHLSHLKGPPWPSQNTTQAFVPSNISRSPGTSHLTALSLGFFTHKRSILMLPISGGPWGFSEKVPAAHYPWCLVPAAKDCSLLLSFPTLHLGSISALWWGAD